MLCSVCSNADHEARNCIKAVKEYSIGPYHTTAEIPKLFAAQGRSEATAMAALRDRIANLKNQEQ
ncbi:MAG: hypothetical protein U0105_02615 [Candidatus Obscuribacterales bacterium]